MALPGNLCYPKQASTNYPYNGDGSREFLKDPPFVELLVAIHYLAEQTKRLRFITAVHKLVVRQYVTLPDGNTSADIG